MHRNVSVAVPTRHRIALINRFVETFHDNTPSRGNVRPYLTIMYDSPSAPGSSELRFDYPLKTKLQEITVWKKSSLTELWNLGIMTAPTDWVLLCNDDIVFKPGWLEYLEEQIASGKYLQINLGHYGAFCVHKSLILKVGWHDERYRGGGYEDIDWQLRLYEAGLKDKVDNSHTFYENKPGHDVGHFIDHLKPVGVEGWQGENNQKWICQKWARPRPANWNDYPSRRVERVIDWHPMYTNEYVRKFGFQPTWPKPHNGIEVFP